MVSNPLDFLVRDERPVDAFGWVRGWLVQHIALAQQLLGALFAKDGARIYAAGHGKADAGRQVRLDDAGDDIDRRALRRHDQVDAGGARFLGQALDQDFDFLAHRHHQIGQFVDDYHDQWQRLIVELLVLVHFLTGVRVKPDRDPAAQRLALGRGDFYLFVEVDDVAHIDFAHLAIPALHLLHRPFQRANRLGRFGNHRRQQVWDGVIGFELQHLGIDEDQPALLRRQSVQQREQDGVQPDRLARPGGSRDQQMRHRGQIGHDGLARDVLAQDDRQLPLGPDEGLAGYHFLERYHLAVDVGQFDAHHGAARNRRHTGGNRAHIAGDVVGEANDTARLDAGGRFQLVHGDDRAGAHAGDLALDVEIVEHGFEQLGIAFERQLVHLWP